MSADGKPSVATSTRQWIRGHYQLVVRLPPPGETFVAADLPDRVATHLRKMQQEGVVHRVGESYVTATDSRGWRDEWRVDRRAFDLAREYADAGGLLPCGHRPVRTLDPNAPDGYTCRADDCDARYDRDAVEEVL